MVCERPARSQTTLLSLDREGVGLFSRFPSTKLLDEEAFQYFSAAVVRRISLVEVSAVVENLGNVANEGL